MYYVEFILKCRTHAASSKYRSVAGGGWVMESKTFEQMIEEEVNLYRAKYKIKVDE